jgi:hypothetical protein
VPLPLSARDCPSQSYFTTGGLPPISSPWHRVHWDSRPEIVFDWSRLALIIIYQHGPHRKHHFQLLLCSIVALETCLFVKPLLSNSCLWWLHSSCLEQICYNTLHNFCFRSLSVSTFMQLSLRWDANSCSVRHLTEPEGSLPASQEFTTGPHLELGESTQHPPILFLQNSSYIIPHLYLGLPSFLLYVLYTYISPHFPWFYHPTDILRGSTRNKPCHYAISSSLMLLNSS